MKNQIIFENDDLKVEESLLDNDELILTNKNNCLSRVFITKKDLEILYHQLKIHEVRR